MASKWETICYVISVRIQYPTKAFYGEFNSTQNTKWWVQKEGQWYARNT